MTIHEPLDSLTHHHLINGFIKTCRCPSTQELSKLASVSLDEIETSLGRLESNHGVVLHPKDRSVWLVHPFSASPTNTWIQQENKGWWAPCMWCALGVATLVGGEVIIHARIGGESEVIEIPVVNGYPKFLDSFAHFALPPKYVWDNVHHYCAMLLPFRNEEQIDVWSEKYSLPRGAAVPIEQAAVLARVWYGRHAMIDYRKWTPTEAQKIFEEVGLSGEFWKLDSTSDRF